MIVFIWPSCVCVGYSVTYSATNFNDSLWSTTVIYASGAGGSASGWRVGSGGHNGAYRQTRMTLNAGSGPTTVWSFHNCTIFTYEPQIQGAIESIDYSEYGIRLTGPQNTGPAVRQNGVFYIAPGLLVNESSWTKKSSSGLTEESFHVVGGTAHPDFSETAPPLELGFATGISTPSSQHGSTTTDIGIDNWALVVHPVPEPATLSLLALGGLAMVRRRKRGGGGL